MIPKPNVEWVKTTLERLNIRVVNDRPGRRKKRGINEVDQNTSRPSSSPAAQRVLNNQILNASQQINMGNISHDTAFQGLNRGIGSFNFTGDIAGRQMDRRSVSNPTHPTQYGNNLQERNLNQSNVLNALPNPGNAYNISNAMSGFDSASNNYQQDQLLSNMLRGDEPQRISHGSNSTQQQLANLAFGSNQHYEVLKEHHMNLLRELQETTQLMDLYHSNPPNNIDNFGSNLTRNRNQESFDPFTMDQGNLLMGSNQMYQSPQSRSNSLGLGNINRHMLGVQNLQNLQIDSQIANTARRDSLRNAGLMFSMSSNEARNNDGDMTYLNNGERKRKNDVD